jgi:probable rRNA maturation factor
MRAPSLSIGFHCESASFSALLATHKNLFRRAIRLAFKARALPARRFAVSIILTNDAAIQILNRDFRKKDKATNVLSFPQIDDFDAPPTFPVPLELGDVFLAYETLQREAIEQNKSVIDHMTHLMVHGVLHLLGFDHETDAQAAIMEAHEKEILVLIGIADPY